MPETKANCPNCGAPHLAGYAVCHYCNTPLVQDLQTQAVQCTQCHAWSEWGATKCVQCQAWVVVKCVFCGALSPNQVPACLSCHEQFAGAPERVAARQAEIARQRTLQTVSTVGSVAVSLLEVAVESSHGGHHHHHQSYGSSGGGGLLGGIADALTSNSSSNTSSSSAGGLIESLADSFTGSSDDNNS